MKVKSQLIFTTFRPATFSGTLRSGRVLLAFSDSNLFSSRDGHTSARRTAAGTDHASLEPANIAVQSRKEEAISSVSTGGFPPDAF
jgi:hypothetical protein